MVMSFETTLLFSLAEYLSTRQHSSEIKIKNFVKSLFFTICRRKFVLKCTLKCTSVCPPNLRIKCI